MAANPLFTGNLGKNKQPALYNRVNSSNVLRQTNLNANCGVPRDTSTPVRKKPRLGGFKQVDMMNESDPWNDEEMVDDEMLLAYDLMESQATQCESVPKPVDNKSDTVPKQVEHFAGGNVNNNGGQRSHSTPPYAGGPHTSSAQVNSRFTFKHSQGSTRPASANSQPYNKQNNYATCQMTKVFYQPPSPTLSGGGTPPKTGSQSRSRNNSGNCKTPIKLKETPKGALQSHSHKVQSNVTFPKTSSAHLASSSVAAGSMIGHQQAQANLGSKNQQQQQQQPTNRMTTPPAGSIATRESPDLPIATQEGGASQRPSLYQQQLEKMRLECENYQRQLKVMKDERYSKDGEIKVLRQNLAKSKSEVSKLQVEKVNIEDRFKTHQSNKEKELAKEVEQLRTQLEFKNVELRESQDSYRNLEQRRLQASETPSHFPASSQVTPPRRSLRVALGSSQARVESSPRGGDIFPTQESFMEDNFSGTRRSPKVRLRSEGQRSSPRKMPVLSSPAKVPVEPPPSQAFTPGPALCATPKMQPLSITTGPVLCTRLQKGRSTGTQLLGKLLETPSRHNPLAGDNEACGRGLLALFTKDATINSAVTAVERNSGKLSPTQSKRSPNTKSPPSTGTALQQPTYNENEDIALRSLHSILNPPHTSTSDPSDHPEDHTADSLLGLLPLIEEQLGEYLDALHNLTTVCDSVPSTNPTSTFSRSSSVECSVDSSSSSGSEDNWIFANLEMSALSCLQTLGQMVCHSDAVCGILMSGGGGSVLKDDRNEEVDMSIMEIDPSAPLIDPTQAPGRQLDAIRALSTNVTLCQSKNQLISKLIRLASIQQPQQISGSIAGSVIEGALSVLGNLAGKAHLEELDRLRLLLINDNLSINLMSDSSLQKTCSTLDIMMAMSRSQELLKRFCNQSDDCLLLHIYQCGLQGLRNSTDSQVTFITSKVIDLLLNIVNSHNTGATFLLETDCQCSMEVIEALLLMLHREHRIYTQYKNTDGFSLLRQGVMLLHSLMTCSDHKLDIEYIQLIISLIRLFRKHPETADTEANLLLDLWDYEDDDDDEELLQQNMEVDS